MNVKIVISLILLCGGFSSGVEYDLYLLAGQSNMDGRGKVVELTEDQKLSPEGAVIFYRSLAGSSGGWKPLAPGFSVPPKYRGELPSTTFGPEIGFASVMGKVRPGRLLAFIKGSKGGTSLRDDWKPGVQGDPESQGACYRTFLETIALARMELEAAGHRLELRGLLWHQGESDSKASSEAHLERMEVFLSRLREDLGAPGLPVVVGEVFDNGKRDSVRDALRRVSNGDVNCGFVSSSGMTTADPGTHFDAASQLVLGERFAETLLELINNEKN